ncbi:MAG: hypothetical protein NXH85_00720 [Pseudomonadaceae bacterium]|nr:hypothetical protein [Pseudomonadaceae bacterium]
MPVSAPAAAPVAKTAASNDGESQAEPANISYAQSTDEQLTTMAADWSSLSAAERRALLTEVKSRMARERQNQANGQNGQSPTVRITTTRRFGRVVRQPDGSLVRIETSVVQVRKAERNADRPGFGAGFENRHSDPEVQTRDDTRAPAQTVKHDQP